MSLEVELIKIYEEVKKSFYQNKFLFYPIYVFISLFIIFLWVLFPTSTLILFLIVASYHFGKEDSCVGNIIRKKFIGIFYFLKGSLVVIAPLSFHTGETLEIFKILNINIIVPHENYLFIWILISFIATTTLLSSQSNSSSLYGLWVNLDKELLTIQPNNTFVRKSTEGILAKGELKIVDNELRIIRADVDDEYTLLFYIGNTSLVVTKPRSQEAWLFYRLGN